MQQKHLRLRCGIWRLLTVPAIMIGGIFGCAQSELPVPASVLAVNANNQEDIVEEVVVPPSKPVAEAGDSDGDEPESTSVDVEAEPAPTAEVAAVSEHEIEFPDGFRPEVQLSAAHQATCKLGVGDVIQDITVTDIDRSHHQLHRLLSDRLTVLIFWTSESAPAVEQFRRIPIDILADFAAQRVKVIAVNVTDDHRRVRELTGDAADKLVSLVDSERSLFHQVATSRLPRIYVLDSAGEILWFDVEYSLSTQRSLRNVLAYFLAHG